MKKLDPNKAYTALELFRMGYDTTAIASVWNIKECEADKRLSAELDNAYYARIDARLARAAT